MYVSSYRMNGVDVYLGTWNRGNRSEEGQQRIYAGKRYIINHELYDDDTIVNDIALIKLPAPIFSTTTLPKFDSAGNYKTYEGVLATASGWGDTEDGFSADILRFIEKPISKFSSCNLRYLGGLNSEQQICQQATQKQNTCSGDSGGPLVVFEDGEPILIGATSFGINLGCQSGWPGVFTRITGYLDWIQRHTGIDV
uniref:Peptidase S1 domain-containing protein n=1 Tax=Megaselia scalaris TaxID=36166 RepID=T1GT94_MEGSC